MSEQLISVESLRAGGWEIVFDQRVVPWGNDSHGSTCCFCGSALPEVPIGPTDHDDFLRRPGIGQVELGFKMSAPHGGRYGGYGGYACSERCLIGIVDWAVQGEADHTRGFIGGCPSMHPYPDPSVRIA